MDKKKSNLSLSVRYVANCGLLIKTPELNFLVDVFNKSAKRYNHLSEEELAQINQGCSPYERIDCLLFTHIHSDHYEKFSTLQYLKAHVNTCIVIPENGKRPLLQLQSEGELKNKIIITPGSVGINTILSTKIISLESFNCKHVVYDYPYMFCYMLTVGDLKILITADMDPEFVDKLIEIGWGDADYTFFNPYILKSERINQLINDNLFGKIFIYHYPSDEVSDVLGLREIANEWKKNYPYSAHAITILDKPYNTIIST